MINSIPPAEHRAESYLVAPVVRTYEKIALAGSEVRLACPRGATFENMPQLGTAASVSTDARLHWGPGGQSGRHSATGAISGAEGQDEAEEEEEAELENAHRNPVEPAESHSAAAAHGRNEQIRWFRNHVPLRAHPAARAMNPNARLHRVAFTARDHRAEFGGGARYSALGPLNYAAQLAPEGWGNHRNERDGGGGGGGARRQMAAGRAAVLAPGNANEHFQPQRAMFNSQRPHLATEPAYELTVHTTPALGRADTSANNGHWFISDYGELVLVGVSAQSAGSYTCLRGGQQSEVLLDVIADESSPGDAAARGGWHENGTARGGRQMMAGQLFSGVERGLASDTSQTMLDDDVDRLASENLVHGRQLEGRVEIGTEFADASNMVPFKRLETGGGGAIGSAQAEPTESGRHRRLAPSSTQFSTSQMARNNQLNLDTGETDAKATRTSSSYQAPAATEQGRRWITLGGGTLAHSAQGQQLHVAENEIIANGDLESIPGLVYTKQHFFCPLMGQTDLWAALESQINLLIETLCPPHSAKQRRPDCRALARPLIGLLMEMDEKCGNGLRAMGQESDLDGNNNEQRSALVGCSKFGALIERLADVVWYKDGLRLGFGADGRGTDKRLNLKLIDLVDKSASTWSECAENSWHCARPTATTRGAEPISSSVVFNELGDETTSEADGGILLPPRGLILEIDGIRQPNAGRYSCAMKFNNAKLRNRLLELRGRRPSSAAATCFACAIVMNDKSKCCDTRQTPDEGPEMDTGQLDPSGPGAGSGAQELARDKLKSVIRSQVANTSFAVGASSEPEDEPEDDPERSFAADWIKTSPGIGAPDKSAPPNEALWAHIEQTILRPKPAMVVQTFLLLINERPGK